MDLSNNNKKALTTYCSTGSWVEIRKQGERSDKILSEQTSMLRLNHSRTTCKTELLNLGSKVYNETGDHVALTIFISWPSRLQLAE